jgi:hypothetical protein
MDLFDVVRSCFRRWYILLPLLAVTAFYGHQVYSSVQPVYYSQTVIGLAPPNQRVDTVEIGQAVPRNGLLDIGGAPLIANMAALGLHQAAVVNRVVAAGGQPNFDARLFPVPATSPPIPLVMIDVAAPTAQAATKTLELAGMELRSSLENIQSEAKVPRDMTVESFVVSPPSEPVAAVPSRTRSTMSVIVGGLGLAILVSVLADVLLGRRRKRRRKVPTPDPAPVASQEEESAQPSEVVRTDHQADAVDVR